MSKSINKKSKSLVGKYRANVLSEMKEFVDNLNELSGAYGFEARCLSPWKRRFLDTLWTIFTAMLPVKLREKECLLIQPCALLSEKRCSFFPVESFIHPGSPIKVNTVSPLYRQPTYTSTKPPIKLSEGKYVPLLRLSGEWLLDYGFEIGKKYETYANKNQLILKIGGCIGNDNDNGNGNGNGRRISPDNDNMDKNRNVPDGIGIGGANG